MQSTKRMIKFKNKRKLSKNVKKRNQEIAVKKKRDSMI